MKKVFQTPLDGNYFFGYYDKSPLDLNDQRLLACKSSFYEKFPSSNDSLDIGYFNWKEDSVFIKLTETKAWNWQQGCMLQWLGPECSDKIIYNDIIDNKFVSIVLDIETLHKKVLPMAYYTLSSDGRFALCIDNERHHFFRPGYSYQGIKNKNKNIPYMSTDGIWLMDINIGKVKKIVTLEQLVNINPLSTMSEAVHYVEHLMLAPNNKRFAFLHRWKMKDGGIYSRLFTVNLDGSELFLLSDSGRMSHYCWRNDDEIVAWGGIENPINNLRKYKSIIKYFIKPLLPLYKYLSKGNSEIGNNKVTSLISGDSYILFKDKTSLNKRIGNKVLLKDGHPSFSSLDNNIMLTDTYPDPSDSFNQSLILYSINHNTVIFIDKLSHPKKLSNSSMRCDLHPKFSYSGKFVSVDLIDIDHRAIVLYEV